MPRLRPTSLHVAALRIRLLRTRLLRTRVLRTRVLRSHVLLALSTVTALSLAACQRLRPSRGSAAPAAADDALRPLPAARDGARLPDRLDDSTYWRMVRELSEPGGYFQSENFVSNEMGLQHVIARLEQLAPPGGVYIGVGPEQNFTYLGTIQPRIAFIVDIRRQNLLQQLWYKALFELSPTRAVFLSRLFARPALATALATAPVTLSADSLMARLAQLPPDEAAFHRVFAEAKAQLVQRHGFTLDSSDLATLRYVDSIFVYAGPSLNYSSGSSQRGGGRGGFGRMPSFAQIATTTNEAGVNRGFLGSEATYGTVRDLERRNLVIPVVGDFAGPKALRAVGAWLRARDARVDVFYTSNVEQYLFQSTDNWSRFYANVGAMPLAPNSAFIRSSTNRGGFGRGFGGGSSGPAGFLMTQLTSSITEVVSGAQTGRVRSYGDVLGLSKP